MSGRPALFVVAASTCIVCERGRLSVPALVELRPGRVLCAECAREAVVALVTHYGDAGAAEALAPEPEPVPA